MTIRAILIDPTRQLVEAITMDNSLQGFYKTIQCRAIASYGTLANGDAATGDDEALLNGPTPLFWFGRYPIPLGGRVIITNVDDEGDCINVRSTIDEIQGLVRFVPHSDTERLYVQFHGNLC